MLRRCLGVSQNTLIPLSRECKIGITASYRFKDYGEVFVRIVKHCKRHLEPMDRE